MLLLKFVPTLIHCHFLSLYLPIYVIMNGNGWRERESKKVVITPLFKPLLFNLCNSSRCRKHMLPLLMSMSSSCILGNSVEEWERNNNLFHSFHPKKRRDKKDGSKEGEGDTWRKEILSDHLPSVHSLSKVHSFRGEGDRKKELFHCLPFSHYLLFVNLSVSFVLNQSFYDVLLWFPRETTCAYAVLIFLTSYNTPCHLHGSLLWKRPSSVSLTERVCFLGAFPSRKESIQIVFLLKPSS